MDHSPRVLKSPSAWFSLGFLATICQVLLLRDFLVFCTGSELGIAVLLCTWLAGIAAGAGFSRPLLRSSLSPGVILPICLTLLAFSCPASLTLVRSAGLFVETPAGTLAPLGQLLFIALAAALPPGLLVGITFPLACATESEPSGPEPPHPESGALTIGRVYALEAAGSVSAGLVHTWLLVTLLPAMQTALLSGAALCLAAAWQSRRLGGSLKRGRLLTAGRRSAATAGLLMLIAGLIPALGGRLDRLTLEQRWHSLHPGLELLLTLETPHQRLEVGRLGDQTVFLSNGAVLSTYPDPWVADLWGHLVLSVHPSPRRILLAGGLESGLLAAMLRHPGVEKIRLVEQDPALPALFGRYATGQDRLALTNPRFTLDTGDGRRLINRMAAGLPDHSAGEWDMIVILLPDPTTAMINRYYTREFFGEVRRVLLPTGIMSFAVNSSDNIVGPRLADFLRSLQMTLQRDFWEIVIFPGTMARFFVATKKGVLTRDPSVLAARLKKQGVRPKFFRPELFVFNASLFRQDMLLKILAGAKGVKVNTDLNPRCHFYGLTLWSAQHSPVMADLFEFISRWLTPWPVVAVLGLLGLWLWYRRKKMTALWPLMAVGSVGLTEMTLQILIMISFQTVYGRVYSFLGLLVAAYMAGLAGGGAWMTARLDRPRNPRQTLGLVQILAAGICLLTLIAVLAAHALAYRETMTWAPVAIFPLLTLLAGILGGIHFPLAARVFCNEKKQVGKGAGILNGVDLTCSSLGALVGGLILLPTLGLVWTFIVLIALNLAVAVGCAWSDI